VAHPSLGLPARDRVAGLSAPAARIDATRKALADRALEIAIDRDPTMRDRHDETSMRRLLRDTLTLIDVVVDSLAAGDPGPASSFAEAVPPVYRRRLVPMDDLINLCESIRSAIGAVIDPVDMPPINAALDVAIERFRWHRRIAGDARKRNRILAAIYKGA
jgi:hypothetical protein